MAVFRPNKNKECTFNFDDKFTYSLPVNETVMLKIGNIAKKQAEFVQSLNAEAPDILDKVYNSTLDTLDDIFGEGAGADIMSIYDSPTLFDVAEVVKYISEEYTEAFSGVLNACKVEGTSVPRGRR